MSMGIENPKNCHMILIELGNEFRKDVKYKINTQVTVLLHTLNKVSVFMTLGNVCVWLCQWKENMKWLKNSRIIRT